MSNWDQASRPETVVVQLACLSCACEWNQRKDYARRCPRCGSSSTMERDIKIDVPSVNS